MDRINRMTDAELRDELAIHMGGANAVPPVTDTTRHLMQKKLYRLLSGGEFVSVCSNDPADGDSEESDGLDQSEQPAADPSFRDSSVGSPSAAAAAAASSSPPGSVFRDTYRRRPIHDELDSGIGDSGGVGYYGNQSTPAGANRAEAGAAPSRGFRPSALTCGLVLALLGIVVFLLLHYDPLYENPVPEISH